MQSRRLGGCPFECTSTVCHKVDGQFLQYPQLLRGHSFDFMNIAAHRAEEVSTTTMNSLHISRQPIISAEPLHLAWNWKDVNISLILPHNQSHTTVLSASLGVKHNVVGERKEKNATPNPPPSQKKEEKRRKKNRSAYIHFLRIIEKDICRKKRRDELLTKNGYSTCGWK